MAEDLYWLPHETAVFIPGKRTASDPNLYDTDIGAVAVPAGTQLESVLDTAVVSGVDDCCSLGSVNEASILHTVRVRYGRGDIYTNVSNVLIAVNPFRPLDIYDKNSIDFYQTAVDMHGLPPHIFRMGVQAFHGVTESRKNQAVLISGESGAGKTETTKFMLLYASESLAHMGGDLEEMMLDMNPLLESFGNAKTVRNNNSSRFGKWIEMQVDPAGRSLAGASIQDYLLEETRVCGQGPGERNYHIFYQLGSDQAYREEYKLENAATFNYLKANPLETAGVSDSDGLKLLRQAFVSLKFTEGETDQVLRIASGVLHIGNCEFAPSADDHASIVSKEASAVAAELLHVDAEALDKCMLFKRITTMGDTIETPLDTTKAGQARDSMAKVIYGLLFKWLIARCNNSFVAGLQTHPVQSGASTLFWGILDIAGFEVFQTNSLEQLQINLSNEKLQEFFNRTVFKSELEEYSNEGVSIDNIDYTDNTEALQLIEGKSSIMSVLDDATTSVKQTDKMYLDKLVKEFEKHPHFVKPPVKQPDCFGVKHYAGDVFYTTGGFLEKNVANKPPEVLDLMLSSKLDVLKELAADPDSKEAESGAPRRAAPKSKATQCSKFRRSLQQLMDKLSESQCNFIRCIRPNDSKSPNSFESAKVLHQLKLSGVMDTVKIRKNGYLVRLPYGEFARRYFMLFPKEKRAAGFGSASKETVEQILQAADAGGGSYAFGTSKIFIKEALYYRLERIRKEALEPAVIKIQAAFRGYSTRKHMVEVKDLDSKLKQCIRDFGEVIGGKSDLAMSVKRATLVGESLAHFDLVLLQAMKLPVKLAYLPEARKLRVVIQAKADLTRKMSTASASSSDLVELETVIGQAKNYRIEGELLDKTIARSDTLKSQMALVRELQLVAVSDDFEAVQATVAKARAAKLDQPDAWLIPEGPPEMEKVLQKVKELELAASKRQALEKQVEEHLTVADVEAVTTVLNAALEADIGGQSVDRLRERLAQLEAQAPHFKALEGSSQYTESEIVEAILQKVTDAGLSKPDKWLFPDGPELFVAAQKHLAALQQEAREVAGEELTRQVEAMYDSFDLPAMQTMCSRGAGLVKPEALEKLQQRHDTLKGQIQHRRALKNCAVYDDPASVAAVLRHVTNAGLDVPEKWLWPDGPRLLIQAKERSAALEQIVQVKKKISDASLVYDAEAMEAGFREAEKLGVLQSEYAMAWRVYQMLQNQEKVAGLLANDRLDMQAQLNLHKQQTKLVSTGGAATGSTDFKSQLEKMRSCSDLHQMQAILARPELRTAPKELVAEIKKRVVTIQQQTPHLQALQKAGTAQDVLGAHLPVKAAEKAGLAAPEAWLLPEGPAAFKQAQSRLQQLQSDKSIDRQQKGDLETVLQDLLTSLDVPEMSLALDRAAKSGFKSSNVDAVQARLEKVQKQIQLLRKLRHCTVYDETSAVHTVIQMATKEGFDYPESWIMPGGYEALELARSRLRQLEEEKGASEVVAREARLKSLLKSTDVSALMVEVANPENREVKKEIMIRLEKRLKLLREQTPHYVALKRCPVLEEVEQIQGILEKARAVRLDDSDASAWHDSPKLILQAEARIDYLQKAADLASRLEEPCRTFDVEKLGRWLVEANMLGFQESKRKRANGIVENMQNSAWVEQKLEELIDKGGNDPLDRQATNNLMAQLKAMGVKPNAKIMGAAAKRGGTSDDSEIFASLANFSQLRDPITWGTSGLWSTKAAGAAQTDLATCAQLMLSHSVERISEPLTLLRGDKNLEAEARKCFVNIMRCMGDQPSAFVADKESPILKTAKSKDPELRDEVYVQLMKQLTINPSVESLLAGWKLMSKLINQGLPSEELSQFLRAFLEREGGRQARKTLKPAAAPDKAKRRSTMAEAELRGPEAIRKVLEMKEQQKELAASVLAQFKKIRGC